MNLSKITKTTLVKGHLRIDKNSIIVTLVDTNLKIWNELFNTGFIYSNCNGIIVPNRKFNIGRKLFNGKIHFLDAKKQFQVIKKGTSHKKLKVLASLPLSKKQKLEKNQDNLLDSTSNYYFYDVSIYSQAFKYLNEKFSIEMLTTHFFNELSLIYEKLKKLYPLKSVEVLLIINNTQGVLYNILEKSMISYNKKHIKDLRLFDNFILVSDTKNNILPIFYNEKGKIKPIRTNLNKLNKLLLNNEIEVEVKKEDNFDNKKDVKIKDKPIKSKITNIVKDLAVKKLTSEVDESDNVEIKIDSKELNKILRKNKIVDPDITSNVKTALDRYIKNSNEKLSRDKAEEIVLKAINYTVHGTDKVSEEYLANPNALISKLKEVDTYKVPLRFPKVNNYTINPKDIIDINYTTGQFRQKFEFEEKIHENVKKLFESIESVSTHPVKVKKIEHVIKDNNLDRYIEYTITLQNLTGVNKKPYKTTLKIPSPVNDKYFKIHGNNYIISSQHFMKPLTKTEEKDVRILTNYAITRLQLENLKFNPTQLDEILDYIKVKYPNIVKDFNENKFVFTNGSIIYFNGKILFENKESKFYIDEETNTIKDKLNLDTELKLGKYEFLFDCIRNIIAEVNPDDKLGKTKKSIPYLQVYLMGIHLPLIYYLWTQKGLLHTLNDFGVDYEITKKPKGKFVAIPTESEQFLVMHPKTFREEILVNGLLVQKIKTPIKDFNNKEEIYPYINQQYGSRAVHQISLITENEIDPVTKELLEFENLPTNLPALFSGPCVDKLLNEKPSKLSDLKIYRSRISEMTLNIMYSQIKQAHNRYRSLAEFGDENAKVVFDPNYIFNNLISEGVLQHTSSVNPLSEIMLASRVIKGGPGGVINNRAYKPEHRNIHESQYGVIGANSTKENSLVGLTTHHTLTAPIINKYGSYGAKDISNISGWKIVAADESVIPFQNEMDSDRLVLAVTHASQVTPINNSERPIVSTGAEFIIPQLASKRFVLKAKKDGKIFKIDKNKTIHVKYKDGTNDIFDIIPRKSQTKRGAFILLEMKTLKEGSKVKANQVIAYTKNFESDGVYCSGTNVTIAMMNYNSYCHEDSYCITKNFAEKTSTDVLKEISAIIPLETKVLNLEKEIGKKLEGGEILLEFSFQDDLQDYIELNNIDDEVENEDGEVTSLYSEGEDSIKLISPPGEIVDIKIYINNKKHTDKKLINFHNKLIKETKSMIGKIASSIPDKEKQITATDNMNLNFFKIGKHKFKGKEFLGSRIVFSIKQNKILRKGDKLSNRLN